MEDIDTIASRLGDTDELISAVHEDLLALRGAHGRLTVEKFSQYPALNLVCGGGDLLEAFLMFEREMKRYRESGNRDEAAAAISITAPAETVLDRLEYVVGHFERARGSRDQRSGRRWSDRGLKSIATEMVHLAQVGGRLGSELMTIEITGTRSAIKLTIWLLTNKALDERAPLVRFWRHVGDDIVEQSNDLTLDFDPLETVEAVNDDYRLKRYTIIMELPEHLAIDEVDPGDSFYSISIEGRDAPMRTVTFINESDFGPDTILRFTAYRILATVELVKRNAID